MEKLKDLFKNSNYKKLLITILILLGIVSILGVSYANWFINEKQKDFNTLGSKCFELTMANESEGITLNKTYPISDEEGLSTTGYTFTIKNTCNTYATYEVNLEDLLLSENEKRLSGEYIKVSVNDGTPKKLVTYEEKEPTMKESDKSYELTSGSLAPEEEATYTIKLWMDYDTPTLEETMNATFLSKVTIEAGYIPEENLANEILLQATSQTEEINNQKETFEITGTSTNYNLIEYSLDNSHWTRIDEPSKNITITYDFEEEKTYTFYVRDEVGNVKNIEIIPTKLDKNAPTIDIEEINNQSSINLNITLTDEKNSNISYAITETTETPTEWNEYTDVINYTISENKNYYIWAKDEYGNTTYQIYSAATIDTTPPELTISNTLTEWGAKDTITIQATDDVIGISGVSISTSEDTYNWEVVENTLSYETTKEVTSNGTYYISVKDAYEHITTKSIVIDKIDDIKPTIENLHSSSEWGIINQITGTLKDEEMGLSGYQVSKENTEPEEWISITGNSYSLNYEVTENGVYYVWVKDTANNIYSTSIEVNKIDDIAPILSDIQNSSNGDWAQSVTLSWEITEEESEIAKVEYSSDNNSWNELSKEEWYGLTKSNERNDILYIRVTDNAGNVSNVESTVLKIDTTKPSANISINSSTAGSNNWYQALSLKASLSDSGSGVSNAKYCTTTGSTCTPGTNASISNNSFTITLGNSASAQKICVEVTDLVGNSSGTVCSSAYQVDTVNPSLSLGINSSTSGSNGWYKALGVKVTLSDSHSGVSSAKYCTTTGSTCTPGTNATISSNSFTVTLGSNASAQKVCAQTTDKSGRTSSVTCSSTYKVDTTNPTAKISATVSNNTIKVSASGSSDAHSKIDKYQYSRDNKTWYSSTSSSYTFTGLSLGTYTVYVRVVDKAGRTSSTVSKGSLLITQQATTYIASLAGSNLVRDGTTDNNLRYIGANPNNYVTFNNELWRIIGVFNNIDDGTGKKETRLKIIRDEPYSTSMAWDTGNTNDWTTASLQEELNGSYLNSIESPYKEMISNTKWKLGGLSSYTNAITSAWYTYERGTKVYSGRPTEWIGKIGLMYPSDYGYATSGGSTTNRETCLNTELYNWDNYDDCFNNDWLYNSSNHQWTITPRSSTSSGVFIVRSDDYVSTRPAYSRYAVSPALYLNSNVKISGGEGTESSPYQLSL